MGVLACSRSNCGNIMCDTYVDGIGYICGECRGEFKEYLDRNNLDPTNEAEIKEHLSVFMETDKDAFTISEDISVDDFFNKHNRHGAS